GCGGDRRRHGRLRRGAGGSQQVEGAVVHGWHRDTVQQGVAGVGHPAVQPGEQRLAQLSMGRVVGEVVSLVRVALQVVEPDKRVTREARVLGLDRNRARPPLLGGVHQASVEAEKRIIMNALSDANFNKTKAAKLLNIDRKTLYNKIKQFNINLD
ncbi:MAG: helix-turn-helix domain-containing protein, partial [Bacteroidota bacterium]